MTNIISFVVVLGILIFIHEFGHFLLAKLLGVGVEKFSLGFGPKLLGKQIGMTEYRVSAIPLGGYVKLVGESPEAEITEEQKELSFSHKSVGRRILIVAAGPLFNLFLAIIIFSSFFMISGLPILLPEIGAVQEGRPAEKVGLQPNDLIAVIDEQQVESWEDMAALIKGSKGGPLHLEVHRADKIIYLDIVPESVASHNLFGEDIDRYVIGITPSGRFETKDLNPFQAVGESLYRVWEISRLTYLSIVKMVQGKLSTKTLGGPIMIAQMAGQQAEAGLVNLIFFIAFLSIELGLLNLLPIPVLDGGHLLFFFIEAVTRRPVSVKIREAAQRVGLFILGLLMIYVIYNDIMRVLFE
ncbi:MAG: RIP metalloprotease RseP [Pseudomonadota bacterium]